MTAWTVFGGISAAVWMVVALLPWQPHRTRERVAANPVDDVDLSAVTVLVPARNESAHIERTLTALSRQGSNLHVVVVDDQSDDETAAIVAQFADAALCREQRLSVDVVAGAPLPEGWGGKLWALEQGLAQVNRPWCLLLDADIVLAPSMLSSLLEKAESESAVLVSVMARLRCESVWEKLLVPPFIFFFKLLYPFALVARRSSLVAAAAGGCILVKTQVLEAVGAFAGFADALIDDCTLARRVKDAGHDIRLYMSADVTSERGYARLADFWTMVSRTAFTQLRYSVGLLMATTLIMLIVFAAPLGAVMLSGSVPAVAVGLLALTAMLADFSPVSRFYALSPMWRLTLPLAALLFLAMTWHSALNYLTGTRATWKSRSYGRNE